MTLWNLDLALGQIRGVKGSSAVGPVMRTRYVASYSL